MEGLLELLPNEQTESQKNVLPLSVELQCVNPSNPMAYSTVHMLLFTMDSYKTFNVLL